MVMWNEWLCVGSILELFSMHLWHHDAGGISSFRNCCYIGFLSLLHIIFIDGERPFVLHGFMTTSYTGKTRTAE